jgi:hypothetical protein
MPEHLFKQAHEQVAASCVGRGGIMPAACGPFIGVCQLHICRLLL